MARSVVPEPNASPRPAATSIAATTPIETPPASSRGQNVFAFRAELDITEIDGRGRPGTVWTGRAIDLSRSSLTFRSRRMCYDGRELLMAIHLVDDRPVPLFGMISGCEYDGDGLYRTHVNLLPIPQTDAIRAWVHNLHHRHT